MSKHLFLLAALFMASLALSGCPVDLPQTENWQPAKLKRTQEELSAIADKEKEARARQARQLLTLRQYALIQPDEKNCEVDDDCRLSAVHCCSCERGGQLTAMRKDKFASIVRRRVRGCEGNVCPQVVSGHPSCQAKRAICKDKKCVADTPAGPGGQNAQERGIGVETIKDEP